MTASRAPAAASFRAKYFATPWDTFVTLSVAAVVLVLLVPLVRWMIIDANFAGTTRADCKDGGACWVMIRARFDQFMYGFYPPAERWRVNIAGMMLAAAIAALLWKRMPRRGPILWTMLVTFPPLAIWLLYGGIGLAVVETRQWGGLMLTAFLSVYGGLISIPIGILLALGRQSPLPLIRVLSVVFIEFWRGVPIIAVIFLASLLLPLILPAGVGIDRLARAVIGLAFVVAAYMAEAVRGGLQAIPAGQREAAAALGLRYWPTTRLVILPQALRLSLPAITNEFISLVKSTTLVLIVSIFDLLGIAQAAISDPSWAGLNKEAYVFAGAIYWLACFALSRWSKSLETQAHVAPAADPKKVSPAAA